MAPSMKAFCLLLAYLGTGIRIIRSAVTVSVFSVVSVQYEIRGNINFINAFDINQEYYDETSFTEKLERASQRVSVQNS